MKVYFITRFSIYDPAFGGFRLTKNFNEMDYEKHLFDRNRLDQKFSEFQNITLPSIVGQSSNEWRWLIFTSDRLPREYIDRLQALTKQYPSIETIAVKDFSEFFEKTSCYEYGDSFATVRLDDDDGLNACFVEKLQQYSENQGDVVCFNEGRLTKWEKGRVVVGQKVTEKNNAQGLTGIGLNIYSTGRHSDIDDRYRVIYDSSPDMFLLTCSQFTDTMRGFTAFDRILSKLKRLVFLMLHSPREVPGACSTWLKKRF